MLRQITRTQSTVSPPLWLPASQAPAHTDAEPLPPVVLEQMRSCHNAATEFLRQYWSAVLPTPAGALGAGTNSTSAATKAAKAEKMAAYLRGTGGKVEAVVHIATEAGVDPGRIRAVSASGPSIDSG